MYNVIISEQRKIPLPEISGVKIIQDPDDPYGRSLTIISGGGLALADDDREVLISNQECLNRLKPLTAPLDIKEASVVLDEYDAEIRLSISVDIPELVSEAIGLLGGEYIILPLDGDFLLRTG